MELQQQLKILIDDAPKFGIAPIVIEQAIAPVLELFAKQLNHLEYFVLQTLSQDWVLTTIGSSSQPQQEKQVIYAFATVKDAATFQGSDDPNILAIVMPVTHILFEIFSLKQVDSIIFLESPGNLNQGVEIKCDRLRDLILQQIKQLSKTPSDLA